MKELISIPRSLRNPKLLSAQRLPRIGAGVIGSVLLAQTLLAADFTVTSPNFFYAINGNQPNPTLTLVRGQTYTFAVNSSSIHPFERSPDGGVDGIRCGRQNPSRAGALFRRSAGLVARVFFP
jgi:hypothetical protein